MAPAFYKIDFTNKNISKILPELYMKSDFEVNYERNKLYLSIAK